MIRRLIKDQTTNGSVLSNFRIWGRGWNPVKPIKAQNVFIIIIIIIIIIITDLFWFGNAFCISFCIFPPSMCLEDIAALLTFGKELLISFTKCFLYIV